MPTYVVNKLTNSTILFKGGYIEVPPGGSKLVSDLDVKAGVFDMAVVSGQVELVTGEAAPTPIAFTAPEIVVATPPAAASLSEDELKAFLAGNAEQPGVTVTALGQPEVEQPVAEPVAEQPAAESESDSTPTKRGRKKAASADTPTEEAPVETSVETPTEAPVETPVETPPEAPAQ
jgi:outer membrane biosynthesis protein TonB